MRIGHLVNLTHSQALVARALTRAGTPFVEPKLGDGVALEWHAYGAGTAIVEAIFARALDAAYAGPGPLLNGYIRSKATEIRLLAGAVRGGAALVVPAGSPLKVPGDFHGKRIATPGFGNSQDIAARDWLIRAGLRITQTSGDAIILPTSNPDQLALFQSGAVDGVWTVEPWVTRLLNAGGRVLVNEGAAITTLLAATVRFVAEESVLARRFAVAHAELTAWIVANPAQAQALVTEELGVLMGRKLDTALIVQAWPRLQPDGRLDRPAIAELVEATKRAGFARRVPDLAQLYAEVAT